MVNLVLQSSLGLTSVTVARMHSAHILQVHSTHIVAYWIYELPFKGRGKMKRKKKYIFKSKRKVN